MRIPLTSALAMPRGIVCAITTAMVLACIITGFTVAFGTSDSANGTVFRVKPDFDLVFASVNAGPHVEDIPNIVARTAFDQVFASMTRPQPDNTPQNREKLRNAGWRRVLQKG